MKAKYSYGDQTKFIEAVHKPGTAEKRHIASHALSVNVLQLKDGCYVFKFILKSNCKHVQGVVPAQNKCEIRKCFTY